MCPTPYFLQSAFTPFEPELRAVFARALADTKLDPDETQLLITDKSQRLDQYEAEFGALVNPDRVQFTWNGIASLWACAQGIGRLARRMFEAQRAGADRLYLNNDPELENGLYFYELTRRLAKHRFDRWLTGFRFLMLPPPKETISLATDCFSLHLAGLQGMSWRTSPYITTLN
jgi:hypothetical protein